MTNLLYEGLSKKGTSRKTLLSRQFNVNTKLTFYALWSERCIIDINKDPFCLCSKHLLLCTTAAIRNQSKIVDNIVVIIKETNFNYYLNGNFTRFKLYVIVIIEQYVFRLFILRLKKRSGRFLALEFLNILCYV